MEKIAPAEREQLLAMSPDDYMNARQQAFFLQRLQEERRTALEHIEMLKSQLRPVNETGDSGDIAAREEQLRLLLRQIDRESRLLPKIDAALRRLRNGDYGYCNVTGEPIGLKRLMLRPTAELSFEAKIREEQREGHYVK